MNQKREYVASIEKNYGLSVRIEGDLNLVSPEYSIEKLKSATRILSEHEPVLVTADGLMEESVEDETEDFQSDDERPKKRRRRRRKKRQFTNEEDLKADQDDTENQGSAETDDDMSSLSDNTPTENIKQDEKRRRRNKKSVNHQEANTDSVIEKTGESTVGGETELKSTDKLPNEEKEKKKRAPRKSKKVDLENSDEPKLNDEEEKAKQKRRGWWSLKG